MVTLNATELNKIFGEYEDICKALLAGFTVWQYDEFDKRTGWFIITHVDVTVPASYFKVQNDEPTEIPTR